MRLDDSRAMAGASPDLPPPSPPYKGGENPLANRVLLDQKPPRNRAKPWRVVQASLQDQPPAPPATKGATTKARRTAPATRKAAAPRANLPIVTLERFEQAMQVARLAAEHGLADLSFRAVRESLQAGPPVIPVETNPSSRVVVRSARMGDDGPPDQVSPRVIANLAELERLWQKQNVPAEGVYRALREAVLPVGRPTEVFLYASPLNRFAIRHPQSLGKLLVNWAVRAQKTDDLKAAVAARRANPMAELPATALMAQVALATKDSAGATPLFKDLTDRLKRDSSRATADLVCHVAIPALEDTQPEVAAAAMGAVELCTKAFENSAQPEPLASLLVLLRAPAIQTGRRRRRTQATRCLYGGKRTEYDPLQRRLSSLPAQTTVAASRRRIRPRRTLDRRPRSARPLRQRAGLFGW